MSNIKRQTIAGKFLGKRNFLQFWLFNFRVSPSYFCNHSNDFTGIYCSDSDENIFQNLGDCLLVVVSVRSITDRYPILS